MPNRVDLRSPPAAQARNRVKTHRIYSVWEAAEVLGKHRQTIVRWIRKMGLEADTSRKPWLIKGADLKAFLGQRRSRRRCKLELHHCYCLRCKGPRSPDGRMADFTQQTATTGRLTALCPTCGNVMHKIVKRNDLEAIRAKLDVTLQPVSTRLVSSDDAHLNVAFEGETNAHG